MSYTAKLYAGSDVVEEFPVPHVLSIEELIDALQAIRSHCLACSSNTCGHTCPVGKDGICLLAHNGKFPKDWDIRSKHDFSDMKVMK